MDWLTRIQRAIDYIEAHLPAAFNLNDLADAVPGSLFQLQRAFHILSGITLGTYIRNRRLTLAAEAVRRGEQTILDIALQYGYETPESFSRAFQRFHGVLPSQARQPGVTLKAFSPLSIQVNLEGGSAMDYRVEKMGAFSVLGKAEWERIGAVKANAFWQRSGEDGTLDTLTHYSSSPGKEHLGIADGSSYDGEGYLYYIATPYDGDETPAGYLRKEIPERLWVKFRCLCLGAENTADADIWRRIYSEFFPTSAYEPAEYQLEVYPRGDGDYPDDISEVWIAVNPKAPA